MSVSSNIRWRRKAIEYEKTLSIWGRAKRKLVRLFYMTPRAMKYGLRYYFDPDFRWKMKMREVSRMRRYNAEEWRRRVAQRDGWLCMGCKLERQERKLTLDHIVKLSDGGKTIMNNLQLLCRPCHNEKDKV